MSSQKPSSSTAVLQAIRLHGGLSRSRLAEFTGLSRATISEITNSLLRQGWIEELMDGGTPSGKGRPATLLQLASNDRVMVGGDNYWGPQDQAVVDNVVDLALDCAVNYFDVEFLQMHDLTEAEARGDPLVRRVLRVGGAYLGMALAGLVNTFNPEGIVLGGSVPHAFPILVDEATQVMRQRAIMPIASKTCVQLAHLPAWSGALGAISYALDTHFTGPAVR